MAVNGRSSPSCTSSLTHWGPQHSPAVRCPSAQRSHALPVVTPSLITQGPAVEERLPGNCFDDMLLMWVSPSPRRQQQRRPVTVPQARGHSSLPPLSNTPRHRCTFSLYGEKGWGPPRQEQALPLQLRENSARAQRGVQRLKERMVISKRSSFKPSLSTRLDGSRHLSVFPAPHQSINPREQTGS